MRDIALHQTLGGIDIPIADGDFGMTDRLDSAMIITLLAEARADPSEIPAGDDPRGWVMGDIGSKLWLFRREKSTPQVARRIEAAAERATEWMREAGIVARATFTAERAGDRITLRAVMELVGGKELELGVRL